MITVGCSGFDHNGGTEGRQHEARPQLCDTRYRDVQRSIGKLAGEIGLEKAQEALASLAKQAG